MITTRYLTKRQVADRYSTTTRSVERKAAQGILPQPYYFGSRFPRWREDELDAADRRATMGRAPRQPKETERAAAD
jgi:predicted DNA-binding transcriptional regulator AlpA